jgi:hypothetical protein
MYMVARRYADAAALADAMAKRSSEVEELLRGVPGFVAYYAIRDGATVTTVTVCQDREGTQESTRRAADWVKANLAGTSVGAPMVTEGEAFILFGS